MLHGAGKRSMLPIHACTCHTYVLFFVVQMLALCLTLSACPCSTWQQTLHCSRGKLHATKRRSAANTAPTTVHHSCGPCFSGENHKSQTVSRRCWSPLVQLLQVANTCTPKYKAVRLSAASGSAPAQRPERSDIHADVSRAKNIR